VAAGFRQEAKNRIGGKIKDVAENLKRQLTIQNNSGRLKSSAENSNRQPNVQPFRRKFETSAEQSKSSADDSKLQLKI
jgi:uncharacterized protein (UPF0276 family)